ncbi:hypothetical protein [Formosa sp. A9]|uniref:hypothetical protein n=1 Tax=Formosa sp. A9 TaxID=3442641 RepID=UPI003EBC0529
MKKANSVFKYFLSGTLFIVVPLLLVIMLSGKALHLLTPITHKVTEALDLKSVFGPAAVLVVGLLMLVLIGVLCGYFLLNWFLKHWSNTFEERLFYFLPSFQMMKYRLVEEDVYKKQNFWEPILLKEETFYLIAFITDKSHPEVIAVYVPDAPKMDAGEVRYFKKGDIEYLPITMKQAMNALNHFGKGMDVAFSKA